MSMVTIRRKQHVRFHSSNLWDEFRRWAVGIHILLFFEEKEKITRIVWTDQIHRRRILIMERWKQNTIVFRFTRSKRRPINRRINLNTDIAILLHGRTSHRCTFSYASFSPRKWHTVSRVVGTCRKKKKKYISSRRTLGTVPATRDIFCSSRFFLAALANTD